MGTNRVNRIVVEFFDRSLRSGKATRLNSDVLRDVMAVDLRKIAGQAALWDLTLRGD